MDITNQRTQIELKIIEKSVKDEDFRNALIRYPKATIEIEFGVKLPESVNIQILEEESQTFYLVLPYIPKNETEMELSEVELASVAGGDTIWSWVTKCESYESPC